MPVDAEPVAVVAPDAAVAAAPTPVHQVEVEYEPEDASASYRVDPVPPIEFRQSAPYLEPVLESPAEAASESVAVAHDITSITPAGDMHSEPVEAQPAAESLPQGEAGFAPGPGQLAEEVLDVEDSPARSIHASSIEEIDDLDEEETVEGATELGTMLREMSIDQLTRTSPQVDEEDEIEEDDFEEDDLDEEDLEEEDEEEQDDEEGQDQEEQRRLREVGRARRTGSPQRNRCRC